MNSNVRFWTIYKITNPAGRIYIGKTVNLPKRKAAYRGVDCKSQPVLYKSLIKYGYRNHGIEVIDSFCATLSYANGKELFWIRTYLSQITKWPKSNGMNIVAGGQGTIGRIKTQAEKDLLSAQKKGFKHTEEAKKKISEAGKGNKYNVGRKCAPEHIAKRVEKLRGHTFNVGRKQTPEHIEKRTQKIRGVKKSTEHAAKVQAWNIADRGKPIVQFDLNGKELAQFPTISEAARQLNWERSLIRKCLRDIYKTTNNWTFKYIKNES